MDFNFSKQDEAFRAEVRAFVEANNPPGSGWNRRPEDIADACLFLASKGARWITGANLVVDGGVLTATAF